MFSFFRKHTITGRVTMFNRTADRALSVTCDAADGSGEYTLLAYGRIADELELLIFKRRMEGRTVMLTLEYDPSSGEIVNYSLIS